ncbi:helix-turn-helix domain-containing protein [Aquabacter sp. CN5-332]|uniref:TetR/AcrR family transcriptional regulator n=1 Tax=Aquabacter sp. CN5-332 TaxID=3156608 RepID=UPI0032B57EB5
MLRVKHAFFHYGYSKLTMVDLAEVCGFTRRALYYHFKNKEEAFRASIRHSSTQDIRTALEAGERVRQGGGSAVDIISEIMDIRYGTTRRIVQVSPHTVELNAVAFMKCRDIMIEFATSFQSDIENLIVSLAEDGLLHLTGDLSPREIAQALADGARGVNQALPPPALTELSGRYRLMCHSILFGSAVASKSDARAKPHPARRQTVRR